MYLIKIFVKVFYNKLVQKKHGQIGKKNTGKMIEIFSIKIKKTLDSIFLIEYIMVIVCGNTVDGKWTLTTAYCKSKTNIWMIECNTYLILNH